MAKFVTASGSVYTVETGAWPGTPLIVRQDGRTFHVLPVSPAREARVEAAIGRPVRVVTRPDGRRVAEIEGWGFEPRDVQVGDRLLFVEKTDRDAGVAARLTTRVARIEADVLAR